MMASDVKTAKSDAFPGVTLNAVVTPLLEAVALPAPKKPFIAVAVLLATMPVVSELLTAICSADGDVTTDAST